MFIIYLITFTFDVDNWFYYLIWSSQMRSQSLGEQIGICMLIYIYMYIYLIQK